MFVFLRFIFTVILISVGQAVNATPNSAEPQVLSALVIQNQHAAPIHWVRVRIQSAVKTFEIQGDIFRVVAFTKVPSKSGSQKLLGIPIFNSLSGPIYIEHFNNYNWFLRTQIKSKYQPSSVLRIDGRNLRTGQMRLPSTLLLVKSNHSIDDTIISNASIRNNHIEDKPHQDGLAFDLIGVMDIDQYLSGVLKGEMPSSWPMEALKAQAVAARSYTLAKVKERANKLYQLESTVSDQVYSDVLDRIVDGEVLESQRNFQAVQATKGLILRNSKSKSLLKAFYHADCGGELSRSESVWGDKIHKGYSNFKKGEFDTQKSFECVQNKSSNWFFRINKINLFKILKQNLKLTSSIEDIEFLRLSGEQRYHRVQLKLKNESLFTFQANELRRILGYDKVKSTLFRVQTAGPEIIFEGRGMGHGVGLCQAGSRMLANSGWRFDQILFAYYPNSELDFLHY